jgi:peptidoglycan/xylan/chitin deacetylase (PgdA/CDA1 family)
VLEILHRHGAKATFFMIGEAAARAPEMVARVAARGHAIGNHTRNHYSLPLLARRERIAQVRDAEGTLAPFAGKLFRPPYGHQDWGCRWDTWRMGYEVIAFSVHAEDWLAHEADWMANRLVSHIRPGSILILHDQIYRNILPDGHHDRSEMLRALDAMLARLKHNYEFLTIPELLRCGPPVRMNWYEKSPPELEPALRAHMAPGL